MKLKKLLFTLTALIMAFCMIFTIAACDNKEQNQDNPPITGDDPNNSDNGTGNQDQTEPEEPKGPVEDNNSGLIFTPNYEEVEQKGEWVEGEDGPQWVPDENQEEPKLISYTCSGIGTYSGNHLIIPSMFQGLPVVAVKSGNDEKPSETFKRKSTIKKITISEGVKEIQVFTFTGCGNLTEVELPESMEVVDSGAFLECRKLKAITFPKKVTKITDSVCGLCVALEKVVFEGDITYIGAEAFYACSKISEIRFPASLIQVGRMAFMGCRALKTVYYGGTRDEWREFETGYVNEDTPHPSQRAGEEWFYDDHSRPREYTLYCSDDPE